MHAADGQKKALSLTVCQLTEFLDLAPELGRCLILLCTDQRACTAAETLAKVDDHRPAGLGFCCFVHWQWFLSRDLKRKYLRS